MKERDKQILLYSMNVWNGEKWVFFEEIENEKYRLLKENKMNTQN